MSLRSVCHSEERRVSLIEHGFSRCSNTLIKRINADLAATLLFSRGEEKKGDNVSLCSVCHPEERRVSN